MIVLGTAGHIDHGKSAIVRRLTGTDPDRLPEEQSRGMTIDLGFAFYHTPQNDTIALVDVPGHERFVKNMIAGAGGIEGVMLVIAADDGWMPQSEEHFQIVRLLGVRHGLIVINKIDLVETDWLTLLESDIRQRVAGTFLEEAPIFRVSAQTGTGFDALTDHLNTLPTAFAVERRRRMTRLYIDRSFVRPGMGGVVTGTLRGGSLTVGQTVTIWPSLKKARVRTLQSQNRDLTEALHGQRTAVSFTGLEKEALVRGGVVSDYADLAFFRQHPVLALAVDVLKSAPVTLTDRRRLTLMIGTTELDGDIRILSARSIEPGGRGIVFFRPDQPGLAMVGDAGIVRLPSPAVTIGGARVLDHLPNYPRKKHHDRFAYLQERRIDEVPSVITTELQKQVLAPRDGFLRFADFAERDVLSHLKKLTTAKVIEEINGNLFLPEFLQSVTETLLREITAELEREGHGRGLAIEEIQRLAPFAGDTVGRLVLHLAAGGQLERADDFYRPSGQQSRLKGIIKEAHDIILKELTADPMAPPGLPGFAGRGKQFQQAIKYMLDTGEVHKCGAEFLFLTDTWNEFISFVREKLAADNQLVVSDIRDRFGITRKFAIPILEETDRLGLTAREGDVRVKGDRF
jgi:selenocysteine-specific elongation factor